MDGRSVIRPRSYFIGAVALIFAGIESSRTGQPVKVQEMLQQAIAADAVDAG